MPLTDKEKYERRKKNNTKYDAYIPNYLAIPFNEKLKKNSLKYSKWLKENIEKYLKKS